MILKEFVPPVGKSFVFDVTKEEAEIVVKQCEKFGLSENDFIFYGHPQNLIYLEKKDRAKIKSFHALPSLLLSYSSLLNYDFWNYDWGKLPVEIEKAKGKCVVTFRENGDAVVFKKDRGFLTHKDCRDAIKALKKVQHPVGTYRAYILERDRNSCLIRLERDLR